MRLLDVWVVAAWAALLSGLLEGMVLCISRAYPVLLAAHKVSTDVIWVAPAVNLVVFLLASMGVVALVRFARGWLGSSQLLVVYGCFIFLGVSIVITAPAILHPASVVVLSLGITLAVCRKLRDSEGWLTAKLRRQLAWIPGILAVAALAVFGYEQARELWLFRQLPAAPSGATNVLIIVLDTVRSDRFAHSGGNSITPNLDRIASNGVRFDNAWSVSSWSLPTQASILNGRYPHQHGADWPNLRLNGAYPTLAEFFAARGYVSGAFSGNAAWITPEYLGPGFLRFEVYILEDLLRRTVLGRKLGYVWN